MSDNNLHEAAEKIIERYARDTPACRHCGTSADWHNKPWHCLTIHPGACLCAPCPGYDPFVPDDLLLARAVLGNPVYALRHPTGRIDEHGTAATFGLTPDIGEAMKRLEVAESDCLCGDSHGRHMLVIRTSAVTDWSPYAGDMIPEKI